MDERIVKTNFLDKAKGRDMLLSVLGQLSDGIWENSSRVTGYWYYANIDDNGNIVVDNRYRAFANYTNPYRIMSDAAILKYFAKKIKDVAFINLEDEYYRSMRKNIMGKYDTYVITLSTEKEKREYEELSKKYRSCRREYPFIKKGKFCYDNFDELVYLSRDEKVFVTDAYLAYRHLMHLADERSQ